MEGELYSAIKRNLEKDGTLNQLKSDIEHDILHLLGISGLGKEKREMTPLNSNEFLNSLVLEYLDWIGYSVTSTVFNSEWDKENPRKKLDRSQLIKELFVEDPVDTLPLLCQVMSQIKKHHDTEK